VVIRPLSLIDQQRETLLVVYAVADEFLETDPEAPPSWLVRTYKALGDERRLRILRRLGEGEATLVDLAAVLGLAKSTVHHHISILRGAGMIRVHVPRDGGKRHTTYSLRRPALGDAVALLDSYVRTEDSEGSHAS
jgi:DNA-binding transcriptional ArsR family regulator